MDVVVFGGRGRTANVFCSRAVGRVCNVRRSICGHRADDRQHVYAAKNLGSHRGAGLGQPQRRDDSGEARGVGYRGIEHAPISPAKFRHGAVAITICNNKAVN